MNDRQRNLLSVLIGVDAGEVDSVVRTVKHFTEYHRVAEMENVLEEAHDAAEDRSIAELIKYLKEIQRFPTISFDDMTDLLRAAAGAVDRGQSVRAICDTIRANS